MDRPSWRNGALRPSHPRRRPLRHFLRRYVIDQHPGWVFILPSLVLIGLLGLPLLSLAWRAIGKDFFSNILSPTALAALKLSLVTSSVSLLITVIVGTPMAYILARWRFRGKTLLELLVDLPVVLPPSVAGLALLIAFGRQGVFGSILSGIGITLPFTTAAVVIAQTFVSAPLLVRSARVGFSEIERQLVESATVEGANELQVFRYIMFPLAGRAMLTGIVLSWTRALGEFGATIMFAGNLVGKTQTMPLAIFLGFEQGLGVAIALSVMLIAVSFGVLGFVRRLEHRAETTIYSDL
jgi:molybdate transport system permease protein